MTTDERITVRELMQYALYPDQIAAIVAICRLAKLDPFDFASEFIQVYEEIKGFLRGESEYRPRLGKSPS